MAVLKTRADTALRPWTIFCNISKAPAQILQGILLLTVLRYGFLVLLERYIRGLSSELLVGNEMVCPHLKQINALKDQVPMSLNLTAHVLQNMKG
jgi:hypothetical protein